jgi:hypothetical protein
MVFGTFQVISGKDTQPTGIDFKITVQSVFHAEVGYAGFSGWSCIHGSIISS